MTQAKYLKELDELLAEIGSDDYHSSPEFQCDESGGFPVSLCVHWGKEKAWLEPNRKLSEEDSTLMNSVMNGIAEFGIRDCKNEEEYNEILKALGEDAYESAYLTTAEDSGMNM